MLNWFKNLKDGLSQSSEKISSGLKNILKSKKIDKNTLDNLEELLIESDLGINFTSEIISELEKKKLVDTSSENVASLIQKKIFELLSPLEKDLDVSHTPHVILVVGVNGAGKTATIGKIASKFKKQKKKIGLVAADTFRAAASEQLEVWASRTQSSFFSGKELSDPASLAYSSVKKAISEDIDLLLIDTAGRLHNKTDLMNELSKIIRVLKKIDESFPHEVLLVLDGNIGQNSIIQAQTFKEICGIDGLIITKLDGTAKGGVIVPIANELKIPIYALGVGESKDDLVKFDAESFSKALVSSK